MDHADFMRRAIALSAECRAENGDQPFGAVIVKDGRIVGEGSNAIGSACDPTAHGEVVAIRDACRRLESTDLSGCELYTSCEPCPMCVTAMWWAGIERVYYACSIDDAARWGFSVDPALRQEIIQPIDKRGTTAGQLLGDEALAVMKAWAESR